MISLASHHVLFHPLLSGEWSLEEPKESALKGDLGLVLKVPTNIIELLHLQDNVYYDMRLIFLPHKITDVTSL